MRRLGALLILACTACGGRVTDEPSRAAGGSTGTSDASAEADASQGGVIDTPDALGGAAAFPLDASGDTTPDAADGSAAVLDGRPDAPVVIEPDCTCPSDDYFIDVVSGGVTTRLEHPYPLGLLCQETAVQLANNGCDDAYRLTGCAGPEGAAPCLYVAVRLGIGALIGGYVDEEGGTWAIVEAVLGPEFVDGRRARGRFAASFQRQGESLELTGEFLACRPLMPECPASP